MQVLKVASQREFDAGERDLTPGDFGLPVQPYLQALGTHTESTLKQPRPKIDVHLPCMQHVGDRQQRTDLNLRLRFLHRLACGGALQGLAVFHEAGGGSPVAASWLDGALTQQYLALPFRHAADHHARILIMNAAADSAHRPRQVVARWYAHLDGLTAGGTEFHGALRYRTFTEGRSASL